MKKICAIALFAVSIGFGQENDDENKPKHRFVFEPDSMSLNIGETGTVTIKFVDMEGDLVQNPFYIYGRPRRTLESKPRISDSTGVATVTVKPYKAGKPWKMGMEAKPGLRAPPTKTQVQPRWIVKCVHSTVFMSV